VPLLASLFPQFASRLIRNTATIGGNLGTGSPIGDCPPVLLALDARLVLAGPDHEREVELAAFFTGYRTSVCRADELIRAIRIPLPLARLTVFHKIAKRRFDDISSVAVAVAIDVDQAGGGMIERARIGVGGAAATPIQAFATEAALVGRQWSLETFTAAAEVLATEGTPLDDHRASARYRRAMLRSSLLKLHAEHAESELGGVAA
jgi:xanthine dehydrogenase small subunit